MEDDSAEQKASYAQRAAAYWSVDGLPEILRGLALSVLGAGAFFWRTEALGPSTRIRALLMFGGLYAYVFLVERVILDFLKSRITYPRTGYVEPPESPWSVYEPPAPLSLRLDDRPYVLSSLPLSTSENSTSFWPRTVRPIFAFVLLCWVGGGLMGRWLLPLAMPALAVTLYLANRDSERPYSWRWTLILALSGLVFLPVNAPAALQRGLPLLLAGVWLAAQGAHTLIEYLRANPYPRNQGVEG